MKWKMILAIISLSMMVLSACVPAGAAVETTQPTVERETVPSGTSTPVPSKENPAPTEVSPDSIVKQVEIQLAGQESMDAGKAKLIKIEPVMWPDSCLGVEIQGLMCSQVVTPGFRVILETPQGTVEYHTDKSGQHIVLVPQDNTARGSGIDGMVTLGPACPGPSRPDDPKCQDQPYQATITIQDTTGRSLAQITSDANGKFMVDLPPGTYIVHPETPNRLPTAQDMEVTVNDGEYTPVIIQYESGLR